MPGPCSFLHCVLSVLALFAIHVLSLSQEQHRHPVPTQLGQVSFLTSCSPNTQEAFNRGVALLHSFAYTDARKQFLQIAQDDPHCAMAYWGIAMSSYHQLWDPPLIPLDIQTGVREILTARSLGAPTPREQAFIDALVLIFRDAPRIPYSIRALAYEKSMESLAAKNLDDPECQIFFALALLCNASPTDKTHANQKRAAAILEPLFQKYPQHPGIPHYLIHAYDSPELAAQGLPAARAYAQIAPSAPHALHMPSHIFTQLGLWDDSIRSNSAARVAAHAQGDIGEELHSMDYLMYAYLQEVRYADAANLLHDLQSMSQLHYSELRVAYAAASMPARYTIERRAWKDAVSIPLNADSPPQVLAITAWTHAVALARDGKPADAAPELEKLNQFRSAVRATSDSYWVSQIEIQIQEATAWIDYASKRPDDAVAQLRSAANTEDALAKRPVIPGPILPAREQLAEVLLEVNRPSDALREFQIALTNAPYRRNSLIGAAKAAKLSGNSAKAAEFEHQLRSISPGE
jgi:hypothetical protein